MRAGLRSWSWSWSFVACASWLALATLRLAGANSEGDALYTFRRSLSDRDNVLQSWDPTLVNPCTWFHITCNQDNRVTRVYAPSPSPSELFRLSARMARVGIPSSVKTSPVLGRARLAVPPRDEWSPCFFLINRGVDLRLTLD